MIKHVLIDGKRFDLVVRSEGEHFTVTAGEGAATGEGIASGKSTLSGERSWAGSFLDVTIGGRSYEAVVLPGAQGKIEVWIDSERHLVEEERRGSHSTAAGGARQGSGAGRGQPETITAPMPAKVLRVSVSAGETVEEGQTIVVLESMKMEFAIHAPSSGRVKRVPIAEGEMVVAGAELIELEPVSGTDSVSAGREDRS